MANTEITQVLTFQGSKKTYLLTSDPGIETGSPESCADLQTTTLSMLEKYFSDHFKKTPGEILHLCIC